MSLKTRHLFLSVLTATTLSNIANANNLQSGLWEISIDAGRFIPNITQKKCLPSGESINEHIMLKLFHNLTKNECQKTRYFNSPNYFDYGLFCSANNEKIETYGAFTLNETTFKGIVNYSKNNSTNELNISGKLLGKCF